MTRSCKDVLKHLRAISENGSLLSFVMLENRVCSYCDSGKKYYDYSKYSGEFHLILDELAKSGHLEFSGNDSFSLTYKGLHPYIMSWEAFKSFLIRSFFVPVVVSVATSLITLYITAKLSR